VSPKRSRHRRSPARAEGTRRSEGLARRATRELLDRLEDVEAPIDTGPIETASTIDAVSDSVPRPKPIVAFLSVKDVLSQSSLDQVIAATSSNAVVSGSAEHAIFPARATPLVAQRVIAATAEKHIRADEAVEVVGLRIAAQTVRAGRTEETLDVFERVCSLVVVGDAGAKVGAHSRGRERE
jgi:hypothetical protein